MASSRTVSTPVLALLSVAAGLFLGLLLGRHWADRAERAAREQWYAMRRQISEQYSPAVTRCSSTPIRWPGSSP
jgi:hypothetical protein